MNFPVCRSNGAGGEVDLTDLSPICFSFDERKDEKAKKKQVQARLALHGDRWSSFGVQQKKGNLDRALAQVSLMRH